MIAAMWRARSGFIVSASFQSLVIADAITDHDGKIASSEHCPCRLKFRYLPTRKPSRTEYLHDSRPHGIPAGGLPYLAGGKQGSYQRPVQCDHPIWAT